MATTANKFSLFFLLFTLSSFLLQVHARESQFFSKFSNNNPKETQLNPTNVEPQQQQPNFIPQTQDSAGYGLYGHLPPSTTTPAATNGGADDKLSTNLPENYNTVAYTTPIHSKDSYVTTESQYGNKNQYNGDSSMYRNQKQDQFLDNGRYYDNNGENMYDSRKQGMGETSFMDTAVDGGNMYNSEKKGMSDSRVLDNGKYYGPGYTHNSQEQGIGETRFMDKWDRSTTDGDHMYNTEKQGMSDTRFMENGKYYHDLNGESFKANGVVNSRGIDSGNGYNTRGYYGNSDNSYNRYNSNARFQANQEDVFAP